VQILIKLAIADLFPQRCEKLHATKQEIHTSLTQDMKKRRDTACQRIARDEDLLWHVLREAVVKDVIKLFPYVVLDGILRNTCCNIDRYRSLERDRLAAGWRVPDDSDASQDAASKNAPCVLVLIGMWLIVFADVMVLSDLESLYPACRSIYANHVQDAKFADVLGKDKRFKSRKLRLISIRHLLERNRSLDPNMRAELIRHVLMEGNLNRAQQILSRTDEKQPFNTDPLGLVPLSSFSGPGGSEDSLKKDMENLAAGFSDSQFLLDMRGVVDNDMRRVIEQLEHLAHSQLASSIDETVKLMTNAMLKMQQDCCEASIQFELKSKEKKMLSTALIEFIRDINAMSAGRRES
jgi:hypothetical protein